MIWSAVVPLLISIAVNLFFAGWATHAELWGIVVVCGLFVLIGVVWLWPPQGRSSMNEQLKPCPFCGGEVHLSYTGASDWEVTCKGTCQVETRFWISARKFGYGKGETNEAVRRWNTRVSVPSKD